MLQKLLDIRRNSYPHLTVFGELQPNDLDEELTGLLNDLHADIEIGFEQWSRVLSEMKKSHKIEDGIFALKLLDKFPHITTFSAFRLLVGHLGEKTDDLFETMSNLNKIRFLLAKLMKRFMAGLCAC